MTTKDKKSSAKRKTRGSAAASRPAKRTTRSTAAKAHPARRVASGNTVKARPVQQPVRRTSRRRAESQVVYTPPKPFNKLRFLLSLVTVVAIVLALSLGMSIFFKVENILVS